MSALVLVMLALASVSAQTGNFTLAATGPVEKHALAPATVTFEFRVTNSDAVLPREVRFELQSEPAGWSNTSFDPPTAKVTPGASATVSFLVPVKLAATPGTYAFVVEAVSVATGLPIGNTLNFTLIVDSPAPPATNPTPPTLSISLASSKLHGLPGATLANRLRIVVDNVDADGIRVQARGQAPASWPPGSVSLNGDWLVFDERSEPFTVKIPSDAVPGSLHTIRVTAESSSVANARVADFTIEIDAPIIASEPSNPTAPTSNPTPPTSGSSEPSQATTFPTEPDPASSAPPTSGSSLEIALDDESIEVAKGDSAVGHAQVKNTGDAPLDVALTADLGADFEVAFENGGKFPLLPGESRVIRFSIYAKPSEALITGTESVGVLHANGRSAPFTLKVVDAPATGPDAVTEAVATAAAPPSFLDRLVTRYGLATVVAAGAAMGATGAGGITLAASPSARRKLLWIGIGLYTRLSRPKLLDHPERERLFQTIEHNPGIHFHALQRELSWNTGALTYHLRVLERHQLVVSRRDGILRRFYLVGQAPRTMPVTTAPVTGAEVSLSGLRGNVLHTVRERRSIAQSALAEELGASKQTLNYHVKNLERLGLLRVDRVGRDTFLSPAGENTAAPEGAARPPLAYADGGFSRSDEFR